MSLENFKEWEIKLIESYQDKPTPTKIIAKLLKRQENEIEDAIKELRKRR
jgi:hypothetical protein